MLKLLVAVALLVSTPAFGQLKLNAKDRAAKNLGFLVDGFAEPFNKAAASAGSALRSGPARCPPEPDDEEQTCRYDLDPRLSVIVTRRDGHHTAWITLKVAKADAKAEEDLLKSAWALFARTVHRGLTADQARMLADDIWATTLADTAAPAIERGPVLFRPPVLREDVQLAATTDFVPAAVTTETRVRLREALVLNCACPGWDVSWEAYDARLRAVGIRVSRRSRSDPKAMCAAKPDDDDEDKAFADKVAKARPTACREAERRFGPKGSVYPGVMVKAAARR